MKKNDVALIKKDEIEAVAVEWRKAKNKVDKYTLLMNKRADELKKYSKAYANIFVENQCKVTDSTFSRLDEKAIKEEMPEVYQKYYVTKPIKKILKHDVK
tara:strand:- start:294 stop:593 length:300 start_codon:yes stop_codon:yes gene_type:complete